MRKITLLMAILAVSIASMAVGMSGTYKVGTTEVSPNFISLSEAVTAINTNGIDGDVVLEITSNISEAAPLSLATTNGTYTITLKPAATVTPTITFSGCVATAGATQYTALTVNGTSNVIIDGSNTLNGTTKDMTFKMNDGTNGRNVIQLYGNCDNVTIKNMNIVYQSPMSTANSTRAIYLNGQSTGACDNFTVQNCNLGDATQTPYYGIGVTGSSGSSIYCTNVKIKDNFIFGRIRPVYLYFIGTASTSTEVSGNTISTIGGLNGTTTYSIMYNTWAGTFNIFNNRIPTLTTNNSTAQGIYGISGLTAAANSVVNFHNNYIGGNVAATGSAVPPVISLMYIQDNATYNIFQNTFYYSNLTNQNTERSCIHISGSTAQVYLKNNIIYNSTDAATSYCIWKSNGTLTSNYNVLYTSGATSNIGYVSSTAKQTLTNWQSSGYDIQSKSVPVNFTESSTGNLNLTGASVNDYQLAVPRQATVLTDITGTTNRASLTYAGAYEASDLTTVAKQFTVTVPNGTEHTYVAGDFTGKSWDATTPFELTKSVAANIFTGIFPCVDGVNYKYLCEKTGDFDYQEGAYSLTPGGSPVQGSNRTYAVSDIVPIWYRVNKIKLNVTFAATSLVPSKLFVKGSFDSWANAVELAKTGSTFSVILGGNLGDKFPPNTEYKYFTNDDVDNNWESDASGGSISNRWAIAPIMNDEIARFTTLITTKLETPEVSARIMRTMSGIEVQLDSEATVELYNMNGMIIDKVVTSGTYSHDLNNGVYIIRINGKATKFIK